MSNEISITEYALEDSKGSLVALMANWLEVPQISSKLLSVSKGNSAESLRSGLEVTKDVSAAMGDLLENSFQFFKQAGVAFEESDREAARNVDSVARC